MAKRGPSSRSADPSRPAPVPAPPRHWPTPEAQRLLAQLPHELIVIEMARTLTLGDLHRMLQANRATYRSLSPLVWQLQLERDVFVQWPPDTLPRAGAPDILRILVQSRLSLHSLTTEERSVLAAPVACYRRALRATAAAMAAAWTDRIVAAHWHHTTGTLHLLRLQLGPDEIGTWDMLHVATRGGLGKRAPFNENASPGWQLGPVRAAVDHMAAIGRMRRNVVFWTQGLARTVQLLTRVVRRVFWVLLMYVSPAITLETSNWADPSARISEYELTRLYGSAQWAGWRIGLATQAVRAMLPNAHYSGAPITDMPASAPVILADVDYEWEDSDPARDWDLFPDEAGVPHEASDSDDGNDYAEAAEDEEEIDLWYRRFF